MLKEADLHKKADKETYQNAMEGMAIKLGMLQRRIKELKIPVIIVFEGWDAAGKGTLINELILPLDPRSFNVYPTYASNEEERLRPFLWRFWIKTPAQGRIAIFDRSWYFRTLVERVEGEVPDRKWADACQEINFFEQQLYEDGAVIIKLFLHIGKKEQKRRFEKLESNPAMAWRVTKEDWKRHEAYEDYLEAAEDLLCHTDTAHGPWVVVEAQDRRYASIRIFETVIAALEKRIDEKTTAAVSQIEASEKCSSILPSHSILKSIDLSKKVEKEQYKQEMKK